MTSLLHKILNTRTVFRFLNSYKKKATAQNFIKYQKLLNKSKEQVAYNVGEPIYNGNEFFNNLIYKNETWQVVKNRFNDRYLKFFNIPLTTVDTVCTDNKTTIDGDNMYFNTSGLLDDWIYFYIMDYSQKNYELSFDAVFNTEFREIQFGFRYYDFYNRYRFRIEDNQLHFDAVHKGQFYNSLQTEPFKINVDEVYKFIIAVKDNKFSFMSNGNVIMTVTDDLKLFTKGSVALILWDDSGNSNIKCAFNNIQLKAVV
ncbi:hypothetical protein [Flavobacterium subsaxonicum]|uniref:Uncharacterized protein n=1 Tax=Flavobacterium subsaxonicum WB 4.1-42 = DSM 21790 TaxID=1121898 RepID=A0A0A2MYR4_9FLAO|nr:hypothetical protein [Flavobacterium subsaxonicum]KGO93360.1 hypothetical protein Q766_08635 [Flavobacterium subsaxonicum WB 4.1-42 = DSM 21790]